MSKRSILGRSYASKGYCWIRLREMRHSRTLRLGQCPWWRSWTRLLSKLQSLACSTGLSLLHDMATNTHQFLLISSRTVVILSGSVQEMPFFHILHLRWRPRRATRNWYATERRRRLRNRDPKNWLGSTHSRHHPNCSVTCRVMVSTADCSNSIRLGKKGDYLWSERTWSAGQLVDRNPETWENWAAFPGCTVRTLEKVRGAKVKDFFTLLSWPHRELLIILSNKGLILFIPSASWVLVKNRGLAEWH